MTTEIAPKSQCPNCAKEGRDTSENNLAHYANGDYCFACGYTKGKYTAGLELIPGKTADLSNRKISSIVAAKYGIKEKLFSGYINGKFKEVENELLWIFPFKEKDKTVCQQIRLVSDKSACATRGSLKKPQFFGQHLFEPTKQWPLIITAGVLDAPSAYQMTDIPSVSLPNGINSYKKVITENMEWLLGWKEILICVDNKPDIDQEFVEEMAKMMPPGFTRNIVLPLKDANDMLKAGRTDEFKKSVWNAVRVKPKSIVSFLDILDEICEPPEYGSPWPWKFMDKVTYGRRKREVTMIVADSGIGKTQMAYNIAADCINQEIACCHMDLERGFKESSQRSMGIFLNKPIHLPGYQGFDKEEIRAKALEIGEKMHLYRAESGNLSIDAILSSMHYLNKAFNVQLFIIDNLLALASYLPGNGVAHDFCSRAAGRIKQVTNELAVDTIILNHVVKDKVNSSVSFKIDSVESYDELHDKNMDFNKEGMSWQTGRMPEIDHIYGGKATVALVDNVFVLARNVFSDDPIIRRTTLVKPLKSKFHSRETGKVFKLIADENDTGKLIEVFDY